jgi:hypothetical protein
MKKSIFIIYLLLIFTFSNEIILSQTRNPVLEYCTGTWCQWCPCGHSIIKNEIKPAHPNVIVISYHGPANGTDPFSFFPGNSIISQLGFSGYPTGVVDRTSAPQSRTAWLSNVANRKGVAPSVEISSSRSFNQSNRELNITINSTALTALSGSFNLSLILLEDSLFYPQTGNSSCIGGPDYVHNHVARAMINGSTGELLTNTNWERGQTISKSFKYVIPNNIAIKYSSVVAMVYKVGNTLNTSEIQQAEKWKLLDTTATSVPDDFSPITQFELYQNYPNPFNPATKISWQSPVSSWQTLKVFDLLGREVATLIDEYREAGRYEIEFSNAETGHALSLPSGVYFYQLRIGDYISTRKMQLMK